MQTEREKTEVCLTLGSLSRQLG